MKKSILALAALLLVALPLISACGEELTEAEEHVKKGNEYFDESRFDDAIAESNKAIQFDPELAEAYISRGWAYYNLGEFQQAIEDYTEAIRLEPESAEIYADRAYAYTALGQDQEAEPDIERAVELGFDADLLTWAIGRVKAQR